MASTAPVVETAPAPTHAPAPATAPGAAPAGPNPTDALANDAKATTDKLFDSLKQRDQLLSVNPEHTKPWYASYWECFSPVEDCLLTCCCPCITFGRTHHRLHKNANLDGYSPVNGNCLLWCVGSYCCVNVLLNFIQRREIEHKFGLKGDPVKSILGALCCACCDLIQQDKEAKYQLIDAANAGVVTQQPEKVGGMTYGA